MSKSKTKVHGTLSERRHRAGAISGMLAGMPKSCQDVKDGLTDIRSRALCIDIFGKHISRDGLLDTDKIALLDALANQVTEMLDALTACREFADLMARHTTVLPVAELSEVSLLDDGEVSLV